MISNTSLDALETASRFGPGPVVQSSLFPEPPARVQFKRGKKLPAGTVYVGRPSRWGNPFAIGKPDPFRPGQIVQDRADAVRRFEEWLHLHPAGVNVLGAAKRLLRGKSLACWCPCDGQPCHGLVLLRVANPDLA